MRFPLADWIDDHAGCRHNLGASGMRGTIRPPAPTSRQLRAAEPETLRRRLAESLKVDSRRVFLMHGATEGNAAVVWYLSRSGRSTGRGCRVQYPEYPPLFDAARWAGFRLTPRPRRSALALISQPRNPEGDLWPLDRIGSWAEGAAATLIDETFREFAGTPSVLRAPWPNLWATGTFTKFFGADELRVGYVVAPEIEADRFARFHGLMYDELPPRSVAGALALLSAAPRIRAAVHRVLARNLAAWRWAFPGRPAPVGPVGFDRPTDGDGDRLARRCLRASVLVCPGSMFGDSSGVRIGMTRRTFPADLAAYLAVRDRSRPSVPISGRAGLRTARRPLGATGPARGGRG